MWGPPSDQEMSPLSTDHRHAFTLHAGARSLTVRQLAWTAGESIKRAFAAMVKDAGLSEDITPYCLRHTMATELRRPGEPLCEVQELLGHRVGTRVTETYAKFGPDHLMAGARAIDAYFAEAWQRIPLVQVATACHLRASYP